jgi:excisionase family DNA binding protein
MKEDLALKLIALLDLPAAVRELSDRVASLENTLRLLHHLDSERLLDVAGAATLLHMTPAAVRQAVYRGSLPSLRLGRRLRFRRADLLAAPRA